MSDQVGDDAIDPSANRDGAGTSSSAPSAPDGRAPDVPPTAAARALLEGVRDEAPIDHRLQAIAAYDDADLSRIRADRRAGLAFWVNVYNAASELLLDRRPDLFDSRLRFFRAPAITVAGVDLSLDDIEHGILRGGRSKYGLGYLPRLARTGLDAAYRLAADPRIHFALNCGAASCPAVRSYDPETVDDHLDDATRSHLERSVAYDADADRATVPRVCLWFVGDFGGRSGLRTFLRSFEAIPAESSPSIRFAGYDWTKTPRTFAADR